MVEKGLCREAVGNSSQDDGSTCKLRRSCTKRYQCFLVSSLRTGFIRPRMRDISQRAKYLQKQGDILSQGNKAKARARYKADPETKKASVRDSYKADPEKKASVRDSYKVDPEKKKASVRDSYKADPEKKNASVRDSYKADPEGLCTRQLQRRY